MVPLRELAAGTLFAEDYRIIAPLARGGMGVVYVAEQLSTGKRRAIKLMLPELVESPELRARFQREATIGARIESEHVVEVIGAGVDAATGAPWLAMELLSGEHLGALVERLGPLAGASAKQVLAELCHALAAAHRVGIVHRDLKPENVFLAESRREGAPFTVKVLDYGIAKVQSEAKTTTSKTRGGLGTPLWWAPEQAEAGRPVTPATDVWALGLMVYWLLTGRYFWRAAYADGSSLHQMAMEQFVSPLSRASLRAAEDRVADRLPFGFDAWFAACVERDPARRYPEAGAAFAALAPLLLGHGPPPRAELFAAPMAMGASPNALVAPSYPLAQPVVDYATGSAVGFTTGAGAAAAREVRPHLPRAALWLLALVPLGLMAAAVIAVVFFRAVTLQAAIRGCENNDQQACELACKRDDLPSCAAAGLCLFDGKQGVRRDDRKAVPLLTRACDAGHAKACGALAVAYDSGRGGLAKDERRAGDLYGQACDGGEVERCGNLAAALLQGRGALAKDEKRAVDLYDRACSGGVAWACNSFGYALQNGQGGLTVDERRAVDLYRRACDGGSAGGCTNLGFAYERGRGSLPRDSARAVDLYRRGCDGNDLRSCNNLGFAYVRGRGGLVKDEGRAVELFQRACDGADMLGCTNLGFAYLKAQGGLAQNEKRAVELFQRACDGADMLGCTNLGYAYIVGQGGLSKNEKRAVELFQRSCDGGDMLGCTNLGYAYLVAQGNLVKDERRAVELFQRACDGGDALGCNDLGVAHEVGQGGLPKDDIRSFELYQRACDGGDARGCANLGFRYVKGRGVSADRSRGIELLRRGCKGGIAWGCQRLAALGVPDHT
jgi:TPR repeat protein/tRNA A-37 threonylcarbamoyl transferase component Bud32